jgi:hypothetical protein
MTFLGSSPTVGRPTRRIREGCLPESSKNKEMKDQSFSLWSWAVELDGYPSKVVGSGFAISTIFRLTLRRRWYTPRFARPVDLNDPGAFVFVDPCIR